MKIKFFVFMSVVILLSVSGCGSKDAVETRDNGKSTLVYINTSAHKYHRPGCPEAGSNPVPQQLEDAKKNGYRACNKCDPPR